MENEEAFEIPDDLAQCQQLIVDLFARMQSMNARLQALLRARYGSKNENLQPGQLRIFAETEIAAEPSPDDARADSKSQTATGRAKPKRQRANPDLPRVSVLHDVPENEQFCPGCAQLREIIGQDVSEQYDYTPSSIQVIQHVRVKRACRGCHGHVVVGNKPPQVIEKGSATANMLAFVATSKYEDHQPLYRIEGILKRDGAWISRSTMCDWMAASANVLIPLYDRMKEKILESEVIWTDDTPVKMQDRSDDRNIRTSRVWCYIGDEKNPYTIFDFTKSRKRDGPQQFLRGYRGYLQADAFAGYDCIFAGGVVREVACWAHARRKFFEALGSNKKLARQILTLIDELFVLERSVAKASHAARFALRQEQVVPKLDTIKMWLDRAKPVVLPKSPLGGAIGYALNNWDALTTYTASGALTIDNNKAERTLKRPAIGRKNWLFYGSAAGGKTAAILNTILASAKQNGLHPRNYLADVLTRLSSYETDLDSLLPDQWKVVERT